MAQKQFTTFQADILSFELREALLGIVRPGRVSGYDQIAADGTPSASTIYLALSHSAAGVQKLLNGGSSLENPIGVAITTQGAVIHEDDVSIDIDIPDNSGSGSTRWYLVFMEHDYVEVQGANNATYGFVAGTPGAGIPALTEPYHRVILGYIRAVGSATSISGLTYFPSSAIDNIGDEGIGEMLFGEKYLDDENRGSVPAEGVIGDRGYSSQNYITSDESITSGLEDLDAALGAVAALSTVGGTYKLDDWGTPDDNTDLDATTGRHGLLPKLPNDAEQYLNGVGTWDTPQMGWTWLGATGPQFSVSGGTLNVSTPQTLDLDGIVPVGAKEILVEVTMQKSGGLDASNFGRIILQRVSSPGQDRMECNMLAPPNEFTYAYQFYSWHGAIEVNSDNTIYISYGVFVGSTANWNADVAGNDTAIQIRAYRL